MNAQIGGRALFAGAATDSPALADADTILSALTEVTATAADAAEAADRVDDWFAPGGDFDTSGLGYVGSATRMSGFRVADGTRADIHIRADDPAIRETLKGLALAALVKDGPFNGNVEQRSDLARIAGGQLLSSQSAFIAARAEVGTAQATIENATTQNAAERTALSISRNEITSIDPYQTAVELREVEVQLETLYSMTARLSRLSLVNYLRLSALHSLS